MESSVTQLLLVIPSLLLGYAWLLFPPLALCLAQWRRSSRDFTPSPDSPRVDLLISAHNEADVIGARLDNLAALDYPRGVLRVFLGVDGSDDQTAAIARDWVARHAAADWVDVFDGGSRRGKTAMLKTLVARAAARNPAPLLAFSDANTHYDADALRRLVAPLSDPAVDGVCGRLIFHRHGAGETHEGAYWNLETALKTAESRLDSCLGANGAIYVIRRERFWTGLPDNTIVDDFVIGMKVRELGGRMLYEPTACAHEELPATVGDEWRRRVRIGAGDFQALVLCRACLHPRFGWFAWAFWSHKVLRWFTPHLALLALGAAFGTSLRGGRLGIGVLLATLAGLTLAAVGWAWRRAVGRAPAPLRAAEYFIVIQLALFAGFLRYCRGNLHGAWARTARGGGDAARAR